MALALLTNTYLSPATPCTMRLSLVNVPVLSKQHTSTLPANGILKGSVQYTPTENNITKLVNSEEARSTVKIMPVIMPLACKGNSLLSFCTALSPYYQHLGLIFSLRPSCLVDKMYTCI